MSNHHPIDEIDVPLRVRYAEVDQMGVLHHSRYLVYFEMGRTDLLRANGVTYADMEQRKLYYVVARIEVRYLAPARYDDELVLTTRTTRLSYVRVDHEYVLHRGSDRIATATSTLALVGSDGRPTPLPDNMYARLTGRAEPTENHASNSQSGERSQ